MNRLRVRPVPVDTEQRASAPRAASGSAARSRQPLWFLALGIALAAALGAVMARTLVARRGGPAIPSTFGSSFTRTVPRSIAALPLVDARGRRVDLASLHGHVVVLADFLTSCQEACPITTGVLLQTERALVAAGLAQQIKIVEVSIDPGRDVPSRLAAYKRYTGASWQLWTASAPEIERFWHFFGVSYTKVAEARPPGIDWQTHRPYTYDVVHANDVFILDRSGAIRLLTEGMPNAGGSISSSLSSLLDAQGRHNLHQPGFGAWTARDLLGGLSYVYGSPIAYKP